MSEHAERWWVKHRKARRMKINRTDTSENIFVSTHLQYIIPPNIQQPTVVLSLALSRAVWQRTTLPNVASERPTNPYTRRVIAHAKKRVRMQEHTRKRTNLCTTTKHTLRERYSFETQNGCRQTPDHTTTALLCSAVCTCEHRETPCAMLRRRRDTL